MKNYLLISSFAFLGLIFSLNGYSQTGFSVHAGPSFIINDYNIQLIKQRRLDLDLVFNTKLILQKSLILLVILIIYSISIMLIISWLNTYQ